MEPASLNVQFVNETDDIVAATNGWDAGRDSADSDDGNDGMSTAAISLSKSANFSARSVDREMRKTRRPAHGKKTLGRVKIKMEYIKDKVRRYTTFSKRKTGIMKKAYELSALTGTQVMLLVASETGHVYTFATHKLQPMITSDNGKALIQTCLNSPDISDSESAAAAHPSASSSSSTAMPTVSSVPVSSGTKSERVVASTPSDTQNCFNAIPDGHISAAGDIIFLQSSDDKLTEPQIVGNALNYKHAVHQLLMTTRPFDLTQTSKPTSTATKPRHNTVTSCTSTTAESQDVVGCSSSIDLRGGIPLVIATSAEQHDHQSSKSNAQRLMKQEAVSALNYCKQQLSDRCQQQLYQIPGTNQIISLPVNGNLAESLTSGAALFYPPASGLMLAPSSGNAVPQDGYVLGIPGTNTAYAVQPRLTASDERQFQAGNVLSPVVFKLPAVDAQGSGET